MLVRTSNSISVCIPSHVEPNILATLNSLIKCNSDGLKIKVYVLVNNGIRDSAELIEFNKCSFESLKSWAENNKGEISFEVFMDLEMPSKNAGVGLARKILGDKAAEDFKKRNINGVIVYLDADCTVKTNYFRAISDFFGNTKWNAAAIHFEHIIGDEKEDRGIIEYESHLRYYILMQRMIGLPFAIHTVGSSMAVMSESYLAKGGMNKRKAGEDFYFLHKFIKDEECGNITNTTVYPSSRISERVPFGTGRAMINYANLDFTWKTYNPVSFLKLKSLIDNLESIYEGKYVMDKLDKMLLKYLESINFKDNVNQIKRNTSSYLNFKKRFFQFFDAFKLMKYLHFMRDDCDVIDIPISEALIWYLGKDESRNSFQALHELRAIDLKSSMQGGS